MQKELLELFNELKNLDNQDDDLDISEPNQDDDQEYICFEQNIIHYNDGVFDISCLYNLHPTFKFKTIKEVIAFFLGYSNEESGFKIWADGKDDMDIEENAYNIGYYALCLTYIKKLEFNILPQFLNEKQHIYPTTKIIN
jgi:hypothetical protein